MLHINRPQRSCGKVTFLHLSVILSTGGSGRHPPVDPGQTTTPRGPWADIPTPLGRHPPRAETPLGRHPPGQTPSPGQTATAADGTHLTGMHSCHLDGHVFLQPELVNICDL